MRKFPWSAQGLPRQRRGCLRLAHSRVLIALLFAPLTLTAQENDDLWMRSPAARGRIEVVAMDAAESQKLAFWSERSLKQLESDWGEVIPFQTGQPLRMRIDPEIPSVELREDWREGVLYQTIMLSPFSMQQAPEDVANIFTRAMIKRMGLAAQPGNQKNLRWNVPEWLIVGSSHALLSNQSRILFEWNVLQGDKVGASYPEEIARQERLPPTVAAHGNAALLCRWLFQKKPLKFWRSLALEDLRESETWLTLFPNLGTFRTLHIEWDLWIQRDRPKLIAEFRIEDAAWERLEREVKFIPAVYGWSAKDLNRYKAIPFAALDNYLDDPRFEAGMKQWKLSLQEIRFRQSLEFNDKVSQYQEAGILALRASRAKGKKRERLWKQADEMMRIYQP